MNLFVRTDWPKLGAAGNVLTAEDLDACDVRRGGRKRGAEQGGDEKGTARHG